MPLLHDFTSVIPDTASATKIQPSHWNDAHVLSLKGIAYAPTDDSDVASVSAGQNYLRFMRRKFNASASEEYEFSTLPFHNISDFNFASQTPGGTLTAGVGATITLTPVPLGINAANINHKIYVYDGTGTAEAVLITGGTAISGAASGTITFTPANNHSGSWKVSSASAGIQEAIHYAGNNGRHWIPSGTYNLYAEVYISYSNVAIFGSGPGSTLLVTNNATQNGFHCYTATPPAIKNLQFASATAKSGGSAILLNDVAQGYQARIEDVWFSNQYDCITVQNNSYAKIFHCYFQNTQRYGIHLKNPNYVDYGDHNIGWNIFWQADHDTGSGAGVAAIYWESGGGPKIHGNKIIGYAHGIVFSLDYDSPTGTSIAIISNNSIENQNAAGRAIWLKKSTARTGTFERIIISGNQFANNYYAVAGYLASHAIQIEDISHGLITGNYCSVTPGGSAETYGVQISGTCEDWVIDGNSFQDVKYGINIQVGAAQVTVTDNNYDGVTIPFATGSTTSYSDGVRFSTATVASGTNITLGTQDVIFISGTTTIKNIAGGWQFRKVLLVPTGASGVAATTSFPAENIANTKTFTANQPVWAFYYDGYWYIS
jgi:hypothetical protein